MYVPRTLHSEDTGDFPKVPRHPMALTAHRQGPHPGNPKAKPEPLRDRGEERTPLTSMRLELTKRLSLQASQLNSDCLVSITTATSPLLHPSVLEHLQALEYLSLLNAGKGQQVLVSQEAP